MCGPALPIIAVAGALATAGGQLYAGAAAKQQGRFDQQVAEINAASERNAAADAGRRGLIEQRQRYRALGQQIGAQRANMAAAGLDLSFGSAENLIADTAMIGNEDAATIAENTRREQMGFDINASNYTLQGRAARSRGNAAFTTSVFQAAGTLLGGAKQVGDMKAPR